MSVRLLRLPAYFEPELSCEQIVDVLRIADLFTLGVNCFAAWQIDGALTPSNIDGSNSTASSSVFTIFYRALSLPSV